MAKLTPKEEEVFLKFSEDLKKNYNGSLDKYLEALKTTECTINGIHHKGHTQELINHIENQFYRTKAIIKKSDFHEYIKNRRNRIHRQKYSLKTPKEKAETNRITKAH